MSKPTLKYFPIAARNLVPLIALEFSGIEFEMEDVSMNDWPNLKPQTTFGQLPILQDGDEQIAQTNAIAEYVCFKYKKSLLGETPADFAMSAQLLQMEEELIVGLAKCHFDADRSSAYSKYFDETLKKALTNLSKLINAEGRFTKENTLGELAIYALIYLMQQFANTNFLEDFPKIAGFVEKIASQPQAKSFAEKAGKRKVIFNRATLEFGYWAIRGLASSFRLFFLYNGIEVKDNQYQVTPKEGGGWDYSCWLQDAKPFLKQREPLINLPYLIDGNLVVTQTDAIWKYLGRKYNMGGSDETTQVRVEMILAQTMDLRNGFIQLCYSPKEKYEADKPGYIADSVPTHLAKFENFLAKIGTKFIASNEVTIADFHTWDMLDQHRILIGDDFLKEYPTLQGYFNRFGELPAVQEFKNTKDYKLPLNNTAASFK